MLADFVLNPPLENIEVRSAYLVSFQRRPVFVRFRPVVFVRVFARIRELVESQVYGIVRVGADVFDLDAVFPDFYVPYYPFGSFSYAFQVVVEPALHRNKVIFRHVP